MANVSTGRGRDVSIGNQASVACSLIMRGNSVIRNNYAQNNGGGVNAEQNLARIDIGEQAVIENNQAQNSGGGIYYNVDSDGLFTVSGTARISGNRASSYGGGIDVLNGNVQITDDVEISQNSADSGGGIAMLGSGIVVEDGVQINNNRATNLGGGVYINVRQNSTVLIRNSTFLNNEALSGGGMYTLQTSTQEVLDITIENGKFENNKAETSGGGIHFGNGYQTALMRNVTMQNNSSKGLGGGMTSQEGTGRIVVENGCQFNSNMADEGGAIYLYPSRTLSLLDVSFLQNTARKGNDIFDFGNLQIGSDIHIPNGVYLLSVVGIVEQLLQESRVKLESSTLVQPNPEGRHVVVATSSLTLSPQDAAAFELPPEMAGWEARVSDEQNKIILVPIRYRLQYENTLGAQNPNPAEYEIVTPTIVLRDLPNQSDYRFLGWYTAQVGGEKVSEIPLGSMGDKILYAHWYDLKRTVTYYGNDAEGPLAENVPLPQTAREGESVSVASTTPTRKGYAFTGWNTTPNGSGTTYLPGSVLGPITADSHLYAQWKTLTPQYRSVYFMPNALCECEVFAMPCTVQSNQQHIVLPCCAPCRRGFCFVGWNTRADGCGMWYMPGELMNLHGTEQYLFAQWA